MGIKRVCNYRCSGQIVKIIQPAKKVLPVISRG
jgi:hypothetical protein